MLDTEQLWHMQLNISLDVFHMSSIYLWRRAWSVSPNFPLAPHHSDDSDDEMPAIAPLSTDVVSRARKLVNACRASGQRREDFANTILEGNSSGAFGEDTLPAESFFEIWMCDGHALIWWLTVFLSCTPYVHSHFSQVMQLIDVRIDRLSIFSSKNHSIPISATTACPILN